jgi:diguanylate cyclase (GGDEF)-like protein
MMSSEDSATLSPHFQQLVGALVALVGHQPSVLGTILTLESSQERWSFLEWQGAGRFSPQAIRYQTLFGESNLQHCPDGIVESLTVEQSQRFGGLVGGVAIVPLLDMQGYAVGELMVLLQRPDGFTPTLRQAMLQLTLQIHALTQLRQQAMTRQLESVANSNSIAQFDPLTLLPNRAHFSKKVEHEIQEREQSSLRRQGKESPLLALLFVDLDRFKRINDTLGHAIGDQLLKEVASRFATCMEPGDVLARLGGDEFTALLPQPRNQKHAQMTAQMLINSLRRPILIGKEELSVGASIGISFYPQDGRDASTLLQHADIAMYQAKKHSGLALYAPSMSAGGYKRLIEEGELRHAIEEGLLSVSYQPQVDPSTGEWRTLEALARWRHPKRGMVPPAHFVPLAEQTDLIGALGEFILRRACADMAAWRAYYGIDLTISVNFSARQFSGTDMVSQITRILGETNLPCHALEMEMTESTLASSLDNLPTAMRRLRELGVRIAVDDFGTGYSSLAYLRRFPVDAIKVDQSFVSGAGKNTTDNALVRAAVEMAHALNLQAIAEGVENESQNRFLQEIGCDLLQGYYFSQPLTAEQVELHLSQRQQQQAA